MKKSWQAVCIFSVAAIALVVLLIVTAGCGYIRFGEQDEPAFGSLKLSVTEPMSPLVILPGGDNTVVHYIVTVSPQTLPDPPQVQDVPVPVDPAGVLFENLKEDFYDIEIQGFALTGDELITQGSDVVSVIAQELSECTIQMVIIQEPTAQALIYVEIQPPDYVPYDVVNGNWYCASDPGDGWSVAPWFNVDPGVWQMDKTDLMPGYALNVWELWSVGYDTFKIAGAAEAVYLRSYRQTTGTYILDESNIGPALEEGAAITIIWETVSPIMTMFTDGISEVFLDEPYTLTTVTDADPIDTHAWYADGVLLPSELSADLTATAPSEPGMVNYSKVGFKGSIITSASKLIVFTEAPQVLTSADWTPSAPIQISGDTPTVAISADIFDALADPFEDGITIYFRIDPTSHVDALPSVAVAPASGVVASGGVSFNLTNSGSLMPADHDVRVQISTQSDFSSEVLTSFDVIFGNY